MNSTSRPASSATAFIRLNSATRSAQSAIRSEPTCRQPGLASSSRCSCENVFTDHMASFVRSTLLRTWPTRPAACGVVTAATVGSFSKSSTSVLPALARL